MLLSTTRGHRPRGSRNLRNEDILQDMRITAQQCPRGVLTKHRYDELGRYSGQSVLYHFGSWDAAMWLALPELMERKHPTPDQMIADLHRVAEKCRAAVARAKEIPYRQRTLRSFSPGFYMQHGNYGYRLVCKHLAKHLNVNDVWTEIKRAIGITDV